MRVLICCSFIFFCTYYTKREYIPSILASWLSCLSFSLHVWAMALQQISLPHVAPGAQDYVFYYDCWCLAANRVQNPRCKGFNTSLFLSPRQLGSTTTVVFFIASGLVSLWSCEMLVVVLSCLTCNKKLTGAGDGLVFDLLSLSMKRRSSHIH